MIVICHKNPFLEYGAARGLLSNPSLGTITLFLKPRAVSVPFIQDELVASFSGAVLTYACCCGGYNSAPFTCFPEASIWDGKKATCSSYFYNYGHTCPGMRAVSHYSVLLSEFLWEPNTSMAASLRHALRASSCGGIPSLSSSDLVRRYRGGCHCDPVL